MSASSPARSSPPSPAAARPVCAPASPLRRVLLAAAGGAWLGPAGALAAVPRLASAAVWADGSHGLAAAWQTGDGRWQAGWLAPTADGRALQVLAALDLPTRAHQVQVDAQRRLLVAARRPGDWLLRWAGPGHAPQWHWADSDLVYHGHLLLSADGRQLLASASARDSGQGLIVVLDAASWRVRQQWPTHGLDPHQLLWAPPSNPTDTPDTPDATDATDGDRARRLRAPDRLPDLYVANGGIPTAAETGRLKLNLAQMDSSIVRLDGRDGRLQQQWRLADPRLSLRHLALPWPQRRAGRAPDAWAAGLSPAPGRPAVAAGSQPAAPAADTVSARDYARASAEESARDSAAGAPRVHLAIALQAEHDAAAARAHAPVLALLRDDGLHAVAAGQPLAGYGGAIAATPQGLAIGCPRAGVVAHFDAQGRWRGATPLREACALATWPDGSLAAGGAPQAWWRAAMPAPADGTQAGGAQPEAALDLPTLQLDNHWVVAALPPALRAARQKSTRG